ncbi:hypothetical protein [Palleronia caenipelagi]|uniref:Uncharacterized protein n=1 Tax=Palleronia caenipelagi TaxID=2489174 RepID=A0A547PS46_9RHOB|nr:hypothetical protein [Palleronia caenipelagi]TRD16972.1 hypothetical protein FEV53_13630 [Palleronia caenipelagi]
MADDEILHRALIDAAGDVNRLTRNWFDGQRYANAGPAADLEPRVSTIATRSGDTPLVTALDTLSAALTPPASVIETLPNLALWFDTWRPDTITRLGAAVTAMANLVPGGPGLVAAAAGGPDYAASGPDGTPGVFWPEAPNDLGLVLASDVSLAELFLVARFADGTVPVWPNYTVLFASHGDGAESTVVGESGTSRLAAGDAARLISKVSVNGGAFGASLLPLPVSVLRLSASTESLPQITFGGLGVRVAGSNAGRSWQGGWFELAGFSAPLSAADAATVEAALIEKWGVT